MKPRYINLIWGLALVLAGALFLVQNLGILSELSSQLWITFFTGLSLVFFASYFVNGTNQWGWLLPATISASLALIIGLDEFGVNGLFVGAPIFAGVGIPFVVAYFQNPAKNRWALIPAWVMGVLLVILLVTDYVPGELIGTLVLWSIALPFLYVYLSDRSRWWAMIPGGIIGVIGIIPLLTVQLNDSILPAAIMFLFTMPFLFVYFWSQKNWWALIPAGVFLSIGIVVSLSSGNETMDMSRSNLMAGILFILWGSTFFVLWLRRVTAPTQWAIYPASVLAVMGLIAIAFGANTLQNIWPLFIIGVGVLILFRALRKPNMQ